MVPTGSEIVRRRLTVLAVLRVAALLFTFVCQTVFFSLVAGGSMMAMTQDPAVEWSEYLVAVASFLGLAALNAGIVALWWWVTPWLARCVVPVPRRNACPVCAYDLVAATGPLCPECGSALSAEFFGGTPPAGLRSGGLMSVASARAVVSSLLRVAVLVFALATIGVALQTVVAFYWWSVLQEFFDGWDVVAWVLACVVCGAFTVGFARSTDRLAAWVVPASGIRRFAGSRKTPSAGPHAPSGA